MPLMSVLLQVLLCIKQFFNIVECDVTFFGHFPIDYNGSITGGGVWRCALGGALGRWGCGCPARASDWRQERQN